MTSTNLKLDAAERYLTRHFAAPVERPGPGDRVTWLFRARLENGSRCSLVVWRRMLDAAEGPAAIEALLAARDIAGRLRRLGEDGIVVVRGSTPEEVHEQ